MHRPGGGRSALWIPTGLFLVYSLVIITAQEAALPATVIFPAVYYLYAERSPVRWPVIIACIPLALALIPSFLFGAMIYCVLLVSALIMIMYLKRGSIGIAVGAPALFVFVIVTTIVISLAHHDGTTVQEVITRWAAGVMSEVENVYKGILTAPEMSDFHIRIPAIKEMIVRLLPSIILSSVAVLIWFNLLICSWYSKEIVLREWKSPEWMVVFFILAGILTLVPYRASRFVGLNLLITVVQLYFFQGMAIVACFMDERRWPSMMRWPIYILILIQIYIMIIVAGLGLFDTWFDFRKRIVKLKGDE